MDFCPYSAFFGEPQKGIHSHRFLNFAVIDVIFTIIGAWGFSVILNKPFVYCLLILFVIGIFIHRLFCVRTTIDRYLFG